MANKNLIIPHCLPRLQWGSIKWWQIKEKQNVPWSVTWKAIMSLAAKDYSTLETWEDSPSHWIVLYFRKPAVTTFSFHPLDLGPAEVFAGLPPSLTVANLWNHDRDEFHSKLYHAKCCCSVWASQHLVSTGLHTGIKWSKSQLWSCPWRFSVIQVILISVS